MSGGDLETLYIKIIEHVTVSMKGHCKGCCIAVMDRQGDIILFFKLGTPTPCSINFSNQKAFTAYSFGQNNDEVYPALNENGMQSLFDSTFCFIAGGIALKDASGNPFYIGVSTDNPSFDKKLALEISGLI